MKFLITGVAGFIGYHVADLLCAMGHEVIGVDNFNPYYDVALKEKRIKALAKEDYKFFLYRNDLSDPAQARHIFAERYDVVIHLAGQPGVRYSIDNPQAYVRDNVTAFLNVLEEHKNYGHLIYASSSSVYGDGGQVRSFYAATKRMNEEMARAYNSLYGVAATGLRFFTVYGPMGRPDMAYYKFADKIMAGEPIEVYNNGEMMRDFTYIADVANAVARIALAPYPLRHRIYDVGCGKPVSLMEFVRTLEKHLGREAVMDMKPMQPGDVRETEAEPLPLERDFGFRPAISLDDGIGRFARWYLHRD